MKHHKNQTFDQRKTHRKQEEQQSWAAAQAWLFFCPCLIFWVHLFRCVCSSYLCFFVCPTPLNLAVWVWDVLWLLAIRLLSIFSFSHLFSASVLSPKTESSKTMTTNPWPRDSFSTKQATEVCCSIKQKSWIQIWYQHEILTFDIPQMTNA